MAGPRATGRSRFAALLREATENGWVPLTGDGFRPSAPLRDLPAEDRLALDPGGGANRVVLVRSPYEGLALHELAALAVLQSTDRAPVSLRDVAEQSEGRREQARRARSTHRLLCGGARHTVKVDAAGPQAPSHPDLDLESEAVAAALGVPAVPCVQLLLDWPRREVRLSERLEAARTLTRLEAWDAAPAPVRDAALTAWLTPADVLAWEESGRTLVDAVVWRWHGVPDPAAAARWEELRCTPGEARAVLDTGVPPAELVPWLEAGTPAPVAALLVRAGAETPDRLGRRGVVLPRRRPR